MKHISLSANVLLNQQFSSIHHIPPSSTSQMDSNGYTESPIRGPNSFGFPAGQTLCSQSISLKYELLQRIFSELLKVFLSLACKEQTFLSQF